MFVNDGVDADVNADANASAGSASLLGAEAALGRLMHQVRPSLGTGVGVDGGHLHEPQVMVSMMVTLLVQR